jgi:hybrid polyketide synthase/nonribosomal peptide synthetase FtdB
MDEWQKRQYWQKELERDIPVLDLGSLQGYSAGKAAARMQVSLDTRERIDRITKGQPIGKYIFYLTCLKILLSRFFYEEVIAVVSPLPVINGVSPGESYNLVITEVDQERSGKEFLNIVKDKLLDLISHQGIPAGIALPAGAGNIAFVDEHIQSGEHWINIGVLIGLRGDELYMECNDGLSEPFMRRFLSYLLRLCDQVSLDPGSKIGELELLDEEEKRQLIAATENLGDHELLKDDFLHHFNRWVGKTPEAAAAQFSYKTVTYGELDNRSDQIAVTLAARGVMSGDRVVVVLDRSDKLLASILAIWKVGAVYVPVDPVSPRDRIDNIIINADARLILLEFKYRFHTDTAFQAKHLFLESIDGMQTIPRLPLPVSDPHRLAYIIYTSGSTGMPKGVMIENLGMMNHLYAKIQELGLGAGSVLAQNASQSFDISIWQFLAPLLVGGKVRIYSDDVVINIYEFMKDVRQDGITVLELVPTYLATIFELMEPQQIKECLSGVSYLLLTGEDFKADLARQCFSVLDQTRIVNAYGPTETSDDVTHYHLNERLVGDHVPIGRPLPNVHIYVVDPRGRLSPDGVKGEIWVSGIAVGRGYWGDAEKTAASFGVDPFIPERGRLFKTGDIGSRNATGDLLFFGRRDSQVKIRGCRIELSDIETHLCRMDKIKDAVLLTTKGKDAQLFLHAYVRCATGERPAASEIRAFLETCLPSYMIPAAFTFMDSFPLLASGKIDRKAIGLQNPVISPETPARQLTGSEAWLTAVWNELLGLTDAGVCPNFFEVGGNSLKALQLISRVNKAFGVDFTIQHVFDFPTIEAFAARLGNPLEPGANLRQVAQRETMEI